MVYFSVEFLRTGSKRLLQYAEMPNVDMLKNKIFELSAENCGPIQIKVNFGQREDFFDIDDCSELLDSDFNEVRVLSPPATMATVVPAAASASDQYVELQSVQFPMTSTPTTSTVGDPSLSFVSEATPTFPDLGDHELQELEDAMSTITNSLSRPSILESYRTPNLPELLSSRAPNAHEVKMVVNAVFCAIYPPFTLYPTAKELEKVVGDLLDTHPCLRRVSNTPRDFWRSKLRVKLQNERIRHNSQTADVKKRKLSAEEKWKRREKHSSPKIDSTASSRSASASKGRPTNTSSSPKKESPASSRSASASKRRPTDTTSSPKKESPASSRSASASKRRPIDTPNSSPRAHSLSPRRPILTTLSPRRSGVDFQKNLTTACRGVRGKNRRSNSPSTVSSFGSSSSQKRRRTGVIDTSKVIAKKTPAAATITDPELDEHCRLLRQKFKAGVNDQATEIALEETFASRQALISNGPPLSTVREKFPQLFTVSGLRGEFLRLFPGVTVPKEANGINFADGGKLTLLSLPSSVFLGSVAEPGMQRNPITGELEVIVEQEVITGFQHEGEAVEVLFEVGNVICIGIMRRLCPLLLNLLVKA
ncbi:unnamed protein product [Cyprideis torosa]|uniref:Uncharacterized protein n=1 Tax=Cyprideis torosa TaxID=163714 RepID=A0A7R8W5E3_9CRUS|nr:unnamed protein product [Cyprideis torosa]CAG0882798.1 unnamed protein product [Cyprideis torosa]